MTFKRYPKVHRLGKEEVEGILEGVVHIEEKIDGANVQIWMENGELQCGTRNNHIKEGFNGFVDYVRSTPAFTEFFKTHENFRLYGEWLVRHTIAYNETAYKQFYLFDMTYRLDGDEAESFYSKEEVHNVAEKYGFKTPTYHGTLTNPRTQELMEWVGKSTLGEKGEGIVIKNHTFRDKFGSHNYAKIVTESFKEDNGITFGGNNKHSDTYWEMYVVNKYMTLARVEKIMNKLQPLVDKRLDIEHIPRVSSSAYYDMLTEEIWEVSRKVTSLNFKTLQRVATKKAIQIYKDILIGDISVADKT